MTIVNNSYHLPANSSSSSLGIVSFSNYPVKKLAAGTKFHDEMNMVFILESSFKLNDIPVTGKVMHDLNFTADVVDIVLVDEFPCSD